MSNVFTVRTHTENHNQAGIPTFGPHEMSVLIEPTLGHLRYSLTDVPPQPNSPADDVHCSNTIGIYTTLNMKPIQR